MTGVFMSKKIASIVFLCDSVLIALGALGHGLQARHLHAAIDRFPIEPKVHSMIYFVWYFASACMLAFGVTLIWLWRRLLAGDRGPMAVGTTIGVLYVAIGLFGLVYRNGDPFMAVFVVLGSILLTSGYVLSRG